ncbi:MAG: GIY-YIG nuclease family protein [Gemmatimonadetes bacterium]|nr:GIY-YIG nuclease family protein [Gemmatimonadota bacterium]
MDSKANPPELQDEVLGYRSEVEGALDRNDKNLGKVWAFRKEGLERKEIAARIGGQAYNYWACLDAILDGTVPSSPSLAAQAASALRGFARKNPLSESTREVLYGRAEVCENSSYDPERVDAEDRALQRRTATAEKQDTTGIYVYSLPHYRRRPVLPATGEDDDSVTRDRTYYKVGKSDDDVIRRFRQQKTQTVLPEPAVLFRVYETSKKSAGAVEGKFHDHLEAAGHVRQRRPKGTGKEWFLTNLTFLDSIASLLDLPVRKVDEEDGEAA